ARATAASTPIARFPPEVLTRVFWFSSLLEPTAILRCRAPVVADLGWIKVTHVSRFWRQAALGEPTLWADPIMDLGPEWTAAFLARSKAVPLCI
ncbi:hypothetical protein BV25DRAFT_1782844, partial [Artomyces pyxidatus]